MKKISTKFLRVNRSHKKITNPSGRHIVKVVKSLAYDYINVVDPKTGNAIFSVSTKKIEGKTKSEKAQKLGEMVAQKLTEKKIKDVVFDKCGYKYHGRIKTIAEAMRKNGINF